MTFQDLIEIHRQSLRNPQPLRTERRYRAHQPSSRQVFTDWASI